MRELFITANDTYVTVVSAAHYFRDTYPNAQEKSRIRALKCLFAGKRKYLLRVD